MGIILLHVSYLLELGFAPAVHHISMHMRGHRTRSSGRTKTFQSSSQFAFGPGGFGPPACLATMI